MIPVILPKSHSCCRFLTAKVIAETTETTESTETEEDTKTNNQDIVDDEEGEDDKTEEVEESKVEEVKQETEKKEEVKAGEVKSEEVKAEEVKQETPKQEIISPDDVPDPEYVAEHIDEFLKVEIVETPAPASTTNNDGWTVLPDGTTIHKDQNGNDVIIHPDGNMTYTNRFGNVVTTTSNDESKNGVGAVDWDSIPFNPDLVGGDFGD